jgi:hypothetical protein
LAINVFAIDAQELKTEEIIAKHIESIGSKENRDAVKNRIAIGASEFSIKTPFSTLSGRFILASESENLLFVSTYQSADYPFEKIGFWEGDVKIPFIRPGVRGPLGSYLLSNNKIIKDGLLGGSILSTWILLDPVARKGKLEAGGKKKINGRETVILNYVLKGGFSADSSIKLYFDAENFHHLRTEYRQKMPTKNYQIGIFGGDQIGTSNKLVEDFGDFGNESGLLLPHSYKLSLTIDGQAGTREFEWNISISKYLFDQILDDSFFSFDKP